MKSLPNFWLMFSFHPNLSVEFMLFIFHSCFTAIFSIFVTLLRFFLWWWGWNTSRSKLAENTFMLHKPYSEFSSRHNISPLTPSSRSNLRQKLSDYKILFFPPGQDFLWHKETVSHIRNGGLTAIYENQLRCFFFL